MKYGKIWLMCIMLPGKFNVKEDMSILHQFIVGLISNGLDPILAEEGINYYFHNYPTKDGTIKKISLIIPLKQTGIIHGFTSYFQ